LTLTTLLLFAGIAAVAVWLLEIFILAGFLTGRHLFYVGASAVVFSLLSMLSVIVTWTSAQYAGLAVFLFVALLSVLAWISVHLKWILGHGSRLGSRRSIGWTINTGPANSNFQHTSAVICVRRGINR